MSQIYILTEDKHQCGQAKAQNYMGGTPYMKICSDVLILRIKNRAECVKGTRLHGGERHRTEHTYNWRGGHRTYFLDYVEY